MSIVLIPQTTPEASVQGWTDLGETDKYYNLGVNDPVDYDFSGDTVKKGVQINIGGSNYHVTADEPITGTPSDYVKIDMSTLLASYVSNLSGVSWNDTYNFYADGTGNAYIFDEPKSVYDGIITTPKTLLGKFAENAYIKTLKVINTIIVANATVGEWATNSDFARFGHFAYNGGGNYGFLQDDNSACYISGSSLNILAPSNPTTSPTRTTWNIPAATSVLIPRGQYNIVSGTNCVIEINVGGIWRAFSASLNEGSAVFSDGVNVRIRNVDGSFAHTAYYHKY